MLMSNTTEHVPVHLVVDRVARVSALCKSVAWLHGVQQAWGPLRTRCARGVPRVFQLGCSLSRLYVYRAATDGRGLVGLHVGLDGCEL